MGQGSQSEPAPHPATSAQSASALTSAARRNGKIQKGPQESFLAKGLRPHFGPYLPPLVSCLDSCTVYPCRGSRSELQTLKKGIRKKERGSEQERERECLTTALRAVTTDKTSARLRSLSSCTLMHSRAKNTNVWKSRGCCCCVLSSAWALASQRARCTATEGKTTPGRGRGARGCPHCSHRAGSVLLSTEREGLGLC